MLEFGTFSEIIIIVIAGVILLGPKELPRVLYQFGRWLQKLRNLTQQFRHGLDNYVEQGAFDEYVDSQNKKHQEIKKPQRGKIGSKTKPSRKGSRP